MCYLHRKTELLNDLRDYQHKVKELKVSLERAEEGELEAKGVTHDCRQQLEVLETQLRDQAASSKSAIASLQLEIKAFKTKWVIQCSIVQLKTHYPEAVSKNHIRLLYSLNFAWK